MKLLFLRLFMLISCTALLVSCNSSSRNKEVSGDIKTRIPAPNEDGTYSLQITELLGIDYLYNMSGQYVQFFMAPNIVQGHLTGNAPRTRFIKSGDLYIAADSLSLQLATVYAHTQKLAALDIELGAEGVNQWPRAIGVAVRYSGDVQNNAFYDGDTDAMLFVPYTDKNLPVAVNAGILAHEHFHSLFYKLVTIPLNSAGKNPQKVSDTAHSQDEIYKFFDLPKIKNITDSDKISEKTAYHILLMRGLNEGLADFWGWLYTGDADFISHSLPSVKGRRTLKTTSSNLRLNLHNTSSLRGRVAVLGMDRKFLIPNLSNESYDLGSQYSRILKIFTDVMASSRDLTHDQARHEMAKLILQTLPDFKTGILALQGSDFYDPAQFLIALFSHYVDATQDECEVMAEAMNRNQNAFQYSCEMKTASWTLVKKETPRPAPMDANTKADPPAPTTPGVRFE